MNLLRRTEWASAVLATLLVVSLHLVFFSHAGGLWRDEANTVGVSTLPTFGEFLHWLDFDSFPILWLLIMRGWHVIGLGSDGALRVLGCAVGLGLVGALWLNARAFNYRLPFFSLLLLGINSSVIRWGDSIRAYGFGMGMAVLSFATIWLIVRQPTRRHVVWACLVAILSVQTLYYNSFLLFACCVAGAVVCVRRRWWARVCVLLGAGAVAALSMMVYIPVFRHSKNWSALFRHSEIGSAWYWHKFSQAVAPTGGIPIWLWILSFIAILALGVASLLPKRLMKMTDNQQDVALFSSVTVCVGAAAYYMFLARLSYVTEPWYYLAFMALFAAAADAAFSVITEGQNRRIGRLVLVAALLAATFVPVLRKSLARMTNVDLLASELNKRVDKEDFVLVALWHDGVSFNRYYTGPARWETLPPISDHRFHRPDLLLPYMTATNQEATLESLHEQLSQTLKKGHRVWLAGNPNFLRPGETPLILAPAPYSPIGWQLGPYHRSWSTQTAAFLQSHATAAEEVPVPTAQPVNEYENLPLIVVSGWH